LLAHGRWFSPGNPASSSTKTGSHDIAEILLKVAVKKKKKKKKIIYIYLPLLVATQLINTSELGIKDQKKPNTFFSSKL
jgi:hypothetical protein